MSLELDLLTVLLFSILGGVLATRLKQPSVLGVLIAGALVGPNAFGLIQNTQVLELSIEIGAILLLFLVGIELSLRRLLRNGLQAIIIATIKLGLLFYIGYTIAALFGLSGITALAVGSILSITSTVIFIKILEQKELLQKPEVSLLVSVLIIEDIFAVFCLTFFSSLGSEAVLTPFIIFTELITSLALLSIVFLIALKVLKPLLDWLSVNSTRDTITFIAIGICAGMSYLAHVMGISAAVGAFLAGNIVSSLKNANLFQKSVHPFILAFTSLFFFSIGALVDFNSIISYAWLIIALFAAGIFFKIITIGLSTYLFSETDGKGAIFSGLAMVSVGEFSLLIAKEAGNLNLGIDILSITAVVIFLSSITMSSIVSHYNSLYKWLLTNLPKGVLRGTRTVSYFTKRTLFPPSIDNSTKREISAESKSIARNVLGFVFVVFIFITLYNAYLLGFIQSTWNLNPLWIIIPLGLIIALVIVLAILKNTRLLLTNLFQSFLKIYPKETASDRIIFRNVIFVVILFTALILFPVIVSVTNLNPRWSTVSILFLCAILFFLAKSESIIMTIVRKNKKRFLKKNK